MKPVIGIIIVLLLGTGGQAIAESVMEKQDRLRRQATGESKDERMDRIKRFVEEQRKEMQKWEVVLIDKGPGWSRYTFDDQELVIDGDHRKGSPYEFDISDQTTIDRIVTSVRTIRRYGRSCNVVLGFTYERIPAGVGRTLPKTRTLCDTDCFQIQERVKTEYGRSKRLINVQERCTL